MQQDGTPSTSRTSSSASAAEKLPHPVYIQGIPGESAFMALLGPFSLNISL